MDNFCFVNSDIEEFSFLSLDLFGLDKSYYEIENPYEQGDIITKKLKEFGAYVVYYDERPSNNYFIKGLIRIRRSLFQKRINSFLKPLLSKIH